MRIGELSRRAGVSPELLRAWETRYALLHPERTPGGLRLFSEEDERRVHRMRTYIADGISAAEAARLAKLDERDTDDGHASVVEMQGMLEQAVEAMDEELAQAALDRLFVALPLQRALTEAILPFLNQVGERWAGAETSVAQEHFASNVIGARLRGLTRGWGGGVGPRAVLACPPGEEHDLGLLCFGLALREHGWRITYLGANTPLGDIASSIQKLSPTIVVLCVTCAKRLTEARREIATLRRHTRVAVGGAGAKAALVQELDVELLDGDPVSEAAALRP